MNRKQFIILLVVVAVVGAAGWLVRQRNHQSWQSSSATIGQKLLPALPVNDIAEIAIQSGTNQLHLAKRDNLWRVRERNDYPANFSQISDLLVKLADLKIVQTEEVGPSQLGRFNLLPPGAGTNSATQIEFKDQSGKTVNTLLLGKPHLHQGSANSQPGMGGEAWPDGRYVMTGADKTVDVISDPLDNLQPQPASWLDKDFFKIENPRLIEAQFPEATNSWKLTRAAETNDWQLADAKPGEKLDASKISGVTEAFGSFNFNDVGPVKPGNLANHTILTVETFDGFSYSARFAPKQDEDVPASFSISANLATTRTPAKDEKPEDKAKLDKEYKDHLDQLTAKLARESQFTNWVYLLSTYTVESLLKPRSELLEEAKTNEPAKDENAK